MHFPHLNVSENVGYGLRNTSLNKDEIEQKIEGTKFSRS